MTTSTGVRKLPERPLDLDGHLRTYGPPAFPSSTAALTAELAAAGVVGRGGGGFPAARKIGAVGRARTVVANGCESEPFSRKDRVLLERSPHLVLDGLLVLARTLGAEPVLCAREHVPEAARRAAGERGVRVVVVPGGYVSSEESALANFLRTGVALPTAKPPRPTDLGVLVHNVETLADVALVVRLGAERYREQATRLATVTGDVARPGVVETRASATVGDLLDLAGPTAPLGAVLAGGYGGRWVRPDEPLRGSGVLAALRADRCGLCETTRVLRWLASQSARQCGPCRFGLPAIAEDFATGAWDRLRTRLPVVTGRGACAHPDGAVRLAASALELFPHRTSTHPVHCGGSR
ncbi:NADH-ubiquinone oxidoreductase-F iron-sulfur binding region domain-containing protein [Actinosynnema sp. NPDC020468]|uniref:NADH-ubiquinone oxidoreductase-F iron-sulfur binding region domain-containing protein n=1 Tax=Actinosynnema sp. NPDC020468 TaxID=3154488 RepID=UPI0033D5A86E